MEDDDLIREYLGRLEAASWPLPADRRAELGSEVREHIEAALAEAGRRDTVTIRNVLERLGRPEEIVSTEAEGGTTPPSWIDSRGPAAPSFPAWGAVEIGAVLLITVGQLLLPIVGPIAGLVFVWASTRWTRRGKLVLTVIALLLILLPVLFLLPAGFSGGTAG